MPALLKPPPEPPRVAKLDVLAPRFRRVVETILQDMKILDWDAVVWESLRTEERQRWLYGFGRQWDDGRGIVTKASSALRSWHGWGLAVDIVQNDSTPWIAPRKFWQDLGLVAEVHGCTWGGRWHSLDLPHIQWGHCPARVPAHLYQGENKPDIGSVWRLYGADG